jgi:hypothetical protein
MEIHQRKAFINRSSSNQDATKWKGNIGRLGNLEKWVHLALDCGKCGKVRLRFRGEMKSLVQREMPTGTLTSHCS